MRFDPRNVVELLLRLEQQGMAFRPLTAEVAAALNKGDFQLALEISGRLHSVLESIVATKALIREHVLEADGLGEPGESLGELAIRARTMVILMELGHLRDALRDEPSRARITGWFAGRFQGIDDIVAFFRDGLDRINRIWRPYRQDQPLLSGMSCADRVTMYLTTIRIAQRALRELGDEPDLAQIFEKGVAASDSPAVQIACKRIVTVLGIQVDVEPDRRPPPRRRPAAIASSTAGNQ
jgi:hypothetical protein